MSGKIIIIVLALFFLAGVFLFYGPFLAPPCDIPIEYGIGAFNRGFGIDKNEFIRVLGEAESIWEDPLEKELFVYQPGAPFKVNLVFDERQSATNILAELEGEIGEGEKLYLNLEKKYDDLSASYNKRAQEYHSLLSVYETGLDRYNAEIASYNKRVENYESRVDFWNSRGGAPKKEFNKLAAEQKSIDAIRVRLEYDGRDLKALGDKIEKKRIKLNNEVSRINTLAGRLNRLIEELNLDVSRYNSISADRGEFDAGFYERTADGASISIYNFFDQSDLILIIAHEFGHALSLGHVDDPSSIMYYLKGDQEMKLTNSDIDELKTVCGID